MIWPERKDILNFVKKSIQWEQQEGLADKGFNEKKIEILTHIASWICDVDDIIKAAIIITDVFLNNMIPVFEIRWLCYPFKSSLGAGEDEEYSLFENIMCLCEASNGISQNFTPFYFHLVQLQQTIPHIDLLRIVYNIYYGAKEFFESK